MQDPIKPVPTSDQKFHDGNPATGELGTVVSADWLNTLQSATQSTQQELVTVIQNSGQKTDPARQDQLLQAVQNIAWGGAQRPSTLAGYGIAIASQAEAEAGSDNSKAMTPLLVEQALNAVGLSGYAKPLAAGSLQTVRPNGLYHVDNNLVSGTPVKSNGMLLANFLSPLWGSQLYSAWGGATYEQRLENGNWQPWVRLLKSGQQSTMADYGIVDGATSAQINAAAPAGMVAYFAMKDAPAGWLVADGRTLQYKDYPALAAALGKFYGGDGVTTFTLPDLCGEFLRGWDSKGAGKDPDRTFGSWQAPSLLTASIGPDCIQDLVVEGAIPNTATTKEFNLAMQTDPIKDQDYASTLRGYIYNTSTWAYPGNDMNRPIDNGIGRPLNVNTYVVSGGTRPRNIALLACIKC